MGSGKTRELASNDYNLRRTEMQAAARAFDVRALRDLTSAQIYRRLDIPGLLRRRALHIVQENERVWRAVKLLEAEDGRGFGKLMNASHERDYRAKMWINAKVFACEITDGAHLTTCHTGNSYLAVGV